MLFSCTACCLFSEEKEAESSIEDEVLEVRTQFPRYRVLYNHQKVIQEVQDQMKRDESKNEQELSKHKK